MRALITRPRDDAEPIADALGELGLETVTAPLLTVEPVAVDESRLDGVQAILLTSRNGVRALAATTERRDVPVFAVGDATAALAREHGFTRVESAAGDSIALAALVRGRLDPSDGPLLHGAGATVAGDMAATLEADGFSVRGVVLYEAKPVEALAEEARESLARGELDFILFFSPRTAETFVILARAAGLEAACANVTAVCLSSAVGQALAALEFRDVRIAERPDADAMIDSVREIQADLVGETKTDLVGETEPDPPPRSENEEEEPPPDEPEEPEEPEEEQPDEEMSEAEKTKIPESTTAPGRETPRETPRAAGGGFRVGVWIVLILLVAAGAGIVTWPSWKGYVPMAGSEAGETLKRRIAELEERIQRLGSAAPAPTPAPAAAPPDLGLAALRERLDRLEKSAPDLAALTRRINDLENAVADLRGMAARPPQTAETPSDMGDRVGRLETAVGELASELAGELADKLAATDDLSRRLEAVESRPRAVVASGASSGDALVLAVGQLRDALSRPGPFAEELRTLGAVASGNGEIAKALAALEPYAGNGIATTAALKQRFVGDASRAARAALSSGDGHWVDRTVARLASVVTVRRVGDDVTGDGAQAVLARAEARLGYDDLAGADAELARLANEPAAAMADWRRDAQTRIAADRALATLTRIAIGRLSASGGKRAD